MELWYWKRLMVWTETYGIDNTLGIGLSSWYSIGTHFLLCGFFIDKDRSCTNKFIRIIILYHRKSKYDKITKKKLKLNKCMGRKKGSQHHPFQFVCFCL